jgi:hypothetical protein
LPFWFCILSFIFILFLQGNRSFQSDIAQYTGMAKEQKTILELWNMWSRWTNSAFGGMPTYQLGVIHTII